MSQQTQRPHFQQAVYDEGYRDGHVVGMAGSFARGETYGRGCQRLENAFRLPLGLAIGLSAGSAVCMVAHWWIG